MTRMIIGTEGRNYIDTRYVECNNTLLFDVTADDGKGNVVCSNLTVSQVQALRKVLDDFIARQPVSVTVTASPERIAALKNDPTLKVQDDDNW